MPASRESTSLAHRHAFFLIRQGSHDMIIELISTGDEVLTGFTQDTNASWLSQRLLEQGWQVRRRHTVGDRMDDLVDIMRERSHVADILLINGGLGPTSDDKTTEAAALAAAVNLELRDDWLAELQQKYLARGREMPHSNRKQALLPEGAALIPNPVGTACGFALTIGRARCYFTPGVPSEFKRMVDEQILPALGANLARGDTRVERFFTFGVSESALSDRLDNLAWPPHLELGYRSSMPVIELKLISQHASQTDFAAAEAQLLDVIRPYLVARGDLDIGAELAGLLGERPLQLLEWGTQGRLIAALAPAVRALEGQLRPLPASAADLLSETARHPGLTLAIGEGGEQGFSLALCSGDGQGWAERLQPGIQDAGLRRKVILFAAQQMLLRYLRGRPVLIDYETLRSQERCSL